MSRAFNIGLICKSCPSSKTPSSVRPRGKRAQILALDSRLRGNERSLLLTPFVPAKAGTQTLALDSRLRGNERSLLLTPFVPAKSGDPEATGDGSGSRVSLRSPATRKRPVPLASERTRTRGPASKLHAERS